MLVVVSPVTGSVVDGCPWPLRMFGSKKSSASGTSAATAWPLLPCRSTSPLSRLWPKRNATVENSLAMVALTFGL